MWVTTNLRLLKSLHRLLALRLDVPALDRAVDRAADGDRRVLVVADTVHGAGVTPADESQIVLTSLRGLSKLP